MPTYDTGRFEIASIESIDKGWYVIEVAADDSLDEGQRQNLGTLGPRAFGVVFSGDKLMPSFESSPLPVGVGLAMGIPGRHVFSEGRCAITFLPERIERSARRHAYGSSMMHERICKIKDGTVRLSWIDLSKSLIEKHGEDKLISDVTGNRLRKAAPPKRIQFLKQDALAWTFTNEERTHPDAAIGQFRMEPDSVNIINWTRQRVVAFFADQRLYMIEINLMVTLHKKNDPRPTLDDEILNSIELLQPELPDEPK